jgi:hypothetical protein
VALALVGVAPVAAQDGGYDLVIRNGRIIGRDGSMKPSRVTWFPPCFRLPSIAPPR